MNGKGDNRRPSDVSAQQWSDNWDRTFNKPRSRFTLYIDDKFVGRFATRDAAQEEAARHWPADIRIDNDAGEWVSLMIPVPRGFER